MRLVGELARRKVLKVGAAYLAMAWVLLQLTDIIAPALQLPDWTMRLVLLLLAVGFPLAVLLAWQFNLTGKGLQPETEGVPARRARMRDWVLLAVIAVLGVGVGVVAQRMLGTGSSAPAIPVPVAAKPTAPAREDASVAVLPFLSMSGAAEDGYFADGLSEEILNSLANIPGLKVAGRTSSFSYKGHDEDLRKIARELGVAHIIEGSVRREGTRLRVTAQLVEATKGFHVWSQTYDRTLDDTLAIQTEIANAVADKLRLSVLPTRDGKVQLDADAQQAYLKAIGLIGEGSNESLEQAVALLRPLHQARPDFIPAYLPLADSVQRLGWTASIPWIEAVDEMRTLSAEASRRAPMALDVRVLAALIPFAENDLAPTYRGYERVLATHRQLADEAPNHPLLQLNTADAARIIDRNELAMGYAERYIALEPRDPKGYRTVGEIAQAMGHDTDAIAAFRRAIGIAPAVIGSYRQLARLYIRTGRFTDAADVVAQCQHAGATGCASLLGDMYRILRQPELAKRADQRDSQPIVAKYYAFAAQRRRGGYRAAKAWIEQQGTEAESLKRYFGNELATAALEDHEYAEVIEWHRWMDPGLFETDAPLLDWQLDPANETGVALLRLGRNDEARQMFQRALQAARRQAPAIRMQVPQLPEATALAWLGRMDEAVAVIRREVANGWVGEYYYTRTNVDTPDPLIEPMRNREDFQELMRIVRTKNAAAFAALKASGHPLIPGATPGSASGAEH